MNARSPGLTPRPRQAGLTPRPRRAGLGLVLSLVAGLGLGSGPAWAACDLPERPTVPDGATASEADMVKAQKAVKDTVAKVERYFACTEREQAKAQALALRSSLAFTPAEAQIWNRRYNDGIDLQTEVADAFNAQVRIYRARQPKGG